MLSEELSKELRVSPVLKPENQEMSLKLMSRSKQKAYYPSIKGKLKIPVEFNIEFSMK